MDSLVSVIVPVYNVEKYLNACIESIINQTYKNLEIILVNDGSTDNSLEICNSYKEKDSRIIIINKKNGGLSDARNFGLDIAKGDYVTLIDSDDTVELDFVEYLLNIIKTKNVNLATTQFMEVFDGKRFEKDTRICDIEVYTDEEAIEHILYQKGFDHSATAKLFKRELFDNIRFPKGKLYEDMAIMYEVIRNAKTIGFGPLKKYYYLIREDSIMHKSFNLNKLDLIEYSSKMVEFVDKNYPRLKKAARRRDNISNFNILRQILMYDGEYKKEEDMIIKNIKRNAKTVLFDKEAYSRDKIAILVLFLGRGIFKFVWLKYKK